jgi:hypothetical protein
MVKLEYSHSEINLHKSYEYMRRHTSIFKIILCHGLCYTIQIVLYIKVPKAVASSLKQSNSIYTTEIRARSSLLNETDDKQVSLFI